MQLVAYGAQDIYLTGNPQITFFKVVYRRHTNFAMECIDQTLQGTAATGGTSTVTISRNGDLVHKVYVTDSAGSATASSEWLSEVELEIGGQKIDKHYKEWMNVWTELSTSESKAVGLKAMQGDIGVKSAAGVGTGVIMSQIPLQFWFCRNPGLALPLIALQYHEVKLKLTWGTLTTAISPKVVCDYIYLDTDERRRFAQVSHEYLIEQLQKQTYTNAAGSHKLNFNHPVKELVWTSPATNAYLTAQLKLNGHDRFSAQQEEYFQLRQPFDHHTAIPRQNLPLLAKGEGLYDTPALQANMNAAKTGAHAATTDTTSEACIVQVSALGAIAGIAVADGTNATPRLVAVWAGASNTFNGTPKVGDIHRIDINDNGTILTSTFGTIKRFYLEGSADGNQTATIAGLVAPFTNLDLTNCVAAASGSVIAAGVVVIEYEEDIVTAAYVPVTTQDNIILTKVASAVGGRTSTMTDKINVYSFGLKPEEHQPSGTCNFSRIDNAQLVLGAQPGAAGNIYAVNYNVLRIMSGMGGLAYSN